MSKESTAISIKINQLLDKNGSLSSPKIKAWAKGALTQLGANTTKAAAVYNKVVELNKASKFTDLQMLEIFVDKDSELQLKVLTPMSDGFQMRLIQVPLKDLATINDDNKVAFYTTIVGKQLCQIGHSAREDAYGALKALRNLYRHFHHITLDFETNGITTSFKGVFLSGEKIAGPGSEWVLKLEGYQDPQVIEVLIDIPSQQVMFDVINVAGETLRIIMGNKGRDLVEERIMKTADTETTPTRVQFPFPSHYGKPDLNALPAIHSWLAKQFIDKGFDKVTTDKIIPVCRAVLEWLNKVHPFHSQHASMEMVFDVESDGGVIPTGIKLLEELIIGTGSTWSFPLRPIASYGHNGMVESGFIDLDNKRICYNVGGQVVNYSKQGYILCVTDPINQSRVTLTNPPVNPTPPLSDLQLASLLDHFQLHQTGPLPQGQQICAFQLKELIKQALVKSPPSFLYGCQTPASLYDHPEGFFDGVSPQPYPFLQPTPSRMFMSTGNTLKEHLDEFKNYFRPQPTQRSWLQPNDPNGPNIQFAFCPASMNVHNLLAQEFSKRGILISNPEPSRIIKEVLRVVSTNKLVATQPLVHLLMGPLSGNTWNLIWEDQDTKTPHVVVQGVEQGSLRAIEFTVIVSDRSNPVGYFDDFKKALKAELQDLGIVAPAELFYTLDFEQMLKSSIPSSVLQPEEEFFVVQLDPVNKRWRAKSPSQHFFNSNW